MEKKRQTRKKAVAGIVTVVLMIALLMAGTLAWKDYSQHASNEFEGDGAAKKYIPHLVEDFEETLDWHIVDGPITKEVRVKNLGGTENYPGEPWDYGDVYIRLQLKEYMEINATPDHYVYSEDRFMIGKDGNFIKFDTEAEGISEGYAAEDLEEIGGYEDRDDNGDIVKRFYVKTKAHDPNGQYGRFLVLDIQKGAGGDMVSVVDGVERASDDVTDKHNDWGKDDTDKNKNGECDYTPHKWKVNGVGKCDHKFHDYIRWNLGDAVVSLTEWEENDGELGEKWIVDYETGWAYWAAPLRPGQTTANLLDSVSLIMDPPGSFYYTIHTDMEAVSYEDLWEKQEGMPEDLLAKYEEAANHPGGLTGTSADIGYVFIADGYEWRVLNVDEDRNIKIVTNKVIGTSVWGTAAAYTTKDLDIRAYIADFYDGLDDLKGYNIPSGMTAQEQNDLKYITKAAGATHNDTSRFEMLLLTKAEVETYFESKDDWVAYDLDGNIMDYYVVTPTPTATVYYVNKTATVIDFKSASSASQLKTDVRGVRPSMFINVTDKEDE